MSHNKVGLANKVYLVLFTCSDSCQELKTFPSYTETCTAVSVPNDMSWIMLFYMFTPIQ